MSNNIAQASTSSGFTGLGLTRLANLSPEPMSVHELDMFVNDEFSKHVPVFSSSGVQHNLAKKISKPQNDDFNMIQSGSSLLLPPISYGSTSRRLDCRNINNKSHDHFSICNKLLFNRQCSTTHQLISTLERPFKCEICGMTFKRKSGLTNHKLTHIGNLPYRCEICGLGFINQGILTRHKSNRHR